MRKAIAFVLYSLAGIILVSTVSALFRNPDPLRFQVQLPENAEVLPATRVHPGTFRIELPWSEVKDRAKAASSPTIVSYGRITYRRARVEAYVPRGDSTFYYSEVMQSLDWPFGFKVDRIARNGNHFTAYSALDWGQLLLAGLVTVVFGLFGWAAEPLRFRKKT